MLWRASRNTGLESHVVGCTCCLYVYRSAVVVVRSCKVRKERHAPWSWVKDSLSFGLIVRASLLLINYVHNVMFYRMSKRSSWSSEAVSNWRGWGMHSFLFIIHRCFLSKLFFWHYWTASALRYTHGDAHTQRYQNLFKKVRNSMFSPLDTGYFLKKTCPASRSTANISWAFWPCLAIDCLAETRV